MAVSKHFWSGLFCLLACLVRLGQAQECSASVPCKVGCCSKFGFCGLGPDYCAEEICVNNCDRKAECDPGGYGSDFVQKTTCPLNVCCSKYGFCGTTAEFCGSKTVSRPSCAVSQGSRFKRVVGYYESWAPSRVCNGFYPEQIPSGVYSHIIFAFASIDPKTFRLVPARQVDVDLYERVANLKRKDPNLKVLIAVGGWTFNDPGPTATTFSDIAADEHSQRVFIDSVLRFLQTYNFDGIDLDWEYPAADDRSGREEDYENFPKFMATIKQALKNYEISITLPASYWYLQHFDLKGLSRSVDFFNLMTYDFHGVWDKPNEWVGPYLNAHTNLTEIKGGLDLLWRNDVDHDKVSLGLAFYGRGFIATSDTCLQPGCTFESGTAAQICSSEVGVMLNAEIDDLVADQNLSPVLDKDAAVQVLTWGGNNWLTYDDETTLQAKADFARSQCLGGVMVWAVSHDTPDAKYSKALGTIAPRMFNALAQQDDSGIVRDETDHEQCRWTNCDENCPANWIRVMRSDKGARKNEFLVNGAGCDGRGVHKFCCPPSGPSPSCGWYSHKNGNCDNGKSCPAGTKEIGSNREYCHRKGLSGFTVTYQAACCDIEPESMTLYGQCDWAATTAGTWPQCSKATCDADVVAFSLDGSGDASCSNYLFYNVPDSDKNKYCCDQPNEDMRWTDCEWQGMTDWYNEDTGLRFCTPTCSGGLVQVAMEHSMCSGGGAKARCCRPNYKTYETRYQNDEDYEFEIALQAFMEDPICRSDPLTGNMKRDVTATGLVQRQTQIYTIPYVVRMVDELYFRTPRESTIVIWNKTVVSHFNSLSYASLHDYLVGTGSDSALRYGSTQMPAYITCNMVTLQDVISDDGGGDGGGSGTSTCVCERTDCCTPDDTECIDSNEDGFTEVAKRAAQDYPWDFTDPATGRIWSLPWRAPDYPSPGDLSLVKDQAKFAEAYTYDPDCTVFFVKVENTIQNGVYIGGYENDHAFERKMLRLWGDDALLGQLPLEGINDIDRVPASFFYTTLQTNVQGTTITYQAAMMNALGSKSNRDVMTLLIKDMNLVKEKLWTTVEDPISSRTMENLVLGTNNFQVNYAAALDKIRRVYATYTWHNEARPHARLATVVVKIRDLIREAEKVYANANNGESPHALDHFDSWLTITLENMHTRTRTWALNWLEELDAPIAGANNRVLSTIRANLVNAFNTLPHIDVTGFFP